jgi:hypothetical protein
MFAVCDRVSDVCHELALRVADLGVRKKNAHVRAKWARV